MHNKKNLEKIDIITNKIFYRGYAGDYGPLESRNNKCIWATSDRRYAQRWGSEFDNVRVAKLKLICPDKITEKFQDSRYDDYDAIELFELAVKKGFKGYWFDDNGAQGICADMSCFEIISEDIHEDVNNKKDINSITEKDVLNAVEKLSDKDDVSYNDFEAIENNYPVLLLTPSGEILNVYDYDTHSQFMDAVFSFLNVKEFQLGYEMAYDYVIEKLGFVTLNTGDGYSDDRCKIVAYSRLTQKQVTLLREWIKRRIKEDKPIIVFVKNEQKTFYTNEYTYDVESIIKSIQRSFSIGILEDINFDYDGRGWITSTGKIISTYNAPHYEKEHKIKNSENNVKYNFGYERYIGLPENRLSFAQYETLTKLLDYFFINKPNVGIRSTDIEIDYDMNDKGDFKWKLFSPKTHTTDDIIKLIKRYYTTGRLNESRQ